MTSTGCFAREPTRHVPAILCCSIDMARTGYCWRMYLNDTEQHTPTIFARISIWHEPATYDRIVYNTHRLLFTIVDMTHTYYCLRYHRYYMHRLQVPDIVWLSLWSRALLSPLFRPSDVISHSSSLCLMMSASDTG